jgi:propionyl-CoA carboxylase beta chain
MLETLDRRRKTILASGGEEKIKERNAKGLLTARQRLLELFQPGTFQEVSMHIEHAGEHFGMKGKVLPADGVIAGVGYVDGRPVAAFSQDFLVAGGSLGSKHAKKIADLQDYAAKAGIPLIGINDSGGARIQEGVLALSGYAQVFFRNVILSGLVPQFSIIAGPCAGGAAYSPALTDFLIMTRKNAQMFICGPEVIKAATGQQASPSQFATAEAHATVSGNIHFVAEDDKHAIAIAKRVLTFLPSNNMMDPPHKLPATIDMAEDPEINNLVPEDSKQPLDSAKVIERLVDGGDFCEVQRDFAKNIRTCNCFNIPLVTLVDTGGFLPGLQQERGGIIRHGAKMLFAYSASTVPKITVVMRKAYGGAYIAMCCRDLGADAVYAWPTAEIAVMGAEGATKILFKKEIAAATDPKAREAELVAEYREKFASPYQAAGAGLVTDVINPAQTRGVLAMALRNALTKRETRPPKKHGNMPL